MNFLGHLFLSHTCDDGYVVGNFLADFIKPKDYLLLPSDFAKGLKLHRFIDEFTDNHECVKKISSLFRAKHGKYSSVIADVIMDYFLYLNWELYSSVNFSDFSASTYEVLSRNIEIFPSSCKPLIQRMIDQNFLEQYQSYDGLDFVFTKLSDRANFENKLTEVTIDLKIVENEVNFYFNRFFPDIIYEVENFIRHS